MQPGKRKMQGNGVMLSVARIKDSGLVYGKCRIDAHSSQ